MSRAELSAGLARLAGRARGPALRAAAASLQKSVDNDTVNITSVVETLSEFLLNFADTELFGKHLSSIILHLVTKTIPLKAISGGDSHKHNDGDKLQHLENCVVLGILSEHPDILQYSLKYFELNPLPPFEASIHHDDSYNVAPKKRRLQQCRQHISDEHVVACAYQFLSKLPNEFATKWNWSKFIENYSHHEDTKIKWMVKECMSILSNMTEVQSKILMQNLGITPDEQLKIIIEENTTIPKDMQTNLRPADSSLDMDLNTNGVINIEGIMLSVYDENNVQNDNLVPVKSTINNLRSLALAVASGKALCLMGPVGSGKTSLVEHLANVTGRKGQAMKKVQLGDQTDSRMLLGTYQCTDVPGEFVWRPGVLTEAVQNGHWLLLEDIDCAALDVASVLSSLLERNILSVPGYRDSLPVTAGFQLFVTQRTVATNYGFQKKMSSSSALLQKHLAQINVEPLSPAELTKIIQELYPSLATICDRMLNVFLMFSVGSHDTSLQNTDGTNSSRTEIALMRGSRLISTRDLLKWCSRAVVDFKVTSPESALKVLQDAIDIFTSSVPLPEHRLELAKKIGTCLGIVETKSEFYVKHHKPNVSLNPSALEVGRAKVLRKEITIESVNFDKKQVVFSFTRPSACLLERIACCVTSNEPVLLVGETGTGKTSSVQYLARQTGHKLIVINMNQQSDSADLLGGYKPVDLKYVIGPIRNEFEDIFRSFYNVEKNKKFLHHIEVCCSTENWNNLLVLMKQSHKAALNRMTQESKKAAVIKKWEQFGQKLSKLDKQVKAASRLTFAFIEGSLVKAMQEGHWVLLDEINLASAEILECLSGLLEDRNESIDLLEKGDRMPIKRHPDFTLFACMNPATDVGKKELPVGLRNRFTEFFVDELQDRNDLILLVGDYLYHMNLPSSILEAIYSFYISIRKEAKINLIDGSGHAPHYSLRTLCRALMAAAKAKCGTVSRSLYESFCLSFLTQLDSSSHPKVEQMIAKAVIGKKELKSVLNQAIPKPQSVNQKYLYFEGHWIPQGKLHIAIPEGYILTPTVRKNLRDIARIISLGKLPVLLQGDTSVGKTSLITYIAKASGNYCVRINNHEHTDLQEYIGSYATDSSGKLVFSEGVLVEAMKKGYWIILDELNLAPSDVLEALNRVLDDNRELYIPETQQVVKADPNFMLFATQNPPGLYGGRKMLSRAFRNRFVELHFDEIPRAELETILHKRCHMPPSYCKKMISVMAELQIRRRGSAAVQGKDGFITLRDLFRWGQRYKLASAEMNKEKGYYDWDQHIADEGYLVLAGKVRQPDERCVIQEVIKKHINKDVDPGNLFTLSEATSPVTKDILEKILHNELDKFSHVVWTFNMRRLAVLIAKSFTFTEPVLLVGETGCGKTTISQILAALRKSELLSVNCHMHTESSDFLGGLRPVRHYKDDGKLFEWVDGPLIKAMEQGHIFLADEISLADDSVLERLNSLLEPERQLVLAERGTDDDGGIHIISAQNNFHFIGTMNPGGDYGKKELSPALRNRFTEIWCDHVSSREDLLQVLEKSVHKGISLGNQEDGSSGLGNCILDFTDWLKTSDITCKFPFSIRDLLSWINFINSTVSNGLLETPEAYVHGACLTFLDCFGTALTGHIEPEALNLLRKNAMDLLLKQIHDFRSDLTNTMLETLFEKQRTFPTVSDSTKFGIKPFYIKKGPYKNQLLNGSSYLEEEQQFTFTAPTTGSNTLRLLRGLQLNKAILLEGNPGVGKTSLVTALAKATGHKVVRINLSDQTDITDLFGTDLPSEDGSFTFKEGAFLSALKNGDWILLDELNLAPQPVLEGLNACLDHRGEIFIPELDRAFKMQQNTRLFACQNPLKQGGARRGLPVSFLNRFTQVYIDILTSEDLIFIAESQYPSIPKDVLHRIIKFNSRISHEISYLQLWGHKGSPWEMNLRDVQRWCDAIISDQNISAPLAPGKFVDMLYVNRMRTKEDKDKMVEIYNEIFSPDYPMSHHTPQICVDENNLYIGDVSIIRNPDNRYRNRRSLKSNLLVLRNQLPTLKSLVQCVKMNWLSILVGQTATGKSSIVQVLADLTGNELQVVPVTSAMDVSDLLGGYEQVDYNRNLENLYDKIESTTIQTVQNLWLAERDKTKRSVALLNILHQYNIFHSSTDALKSNGSMGEEIKLFDAKVSFLQQLCDKLLAYNKQNDISYSNVKEIKDKLRNLCDKVLKATSINAGGKFEWIDSLLVKAMVEGSWILMDNVNLTSSAVLDRLNGLLEPNGILSIPERGEVNEIRPHPNFRIFFTMDAKHGDISRAMRNRGVEIFILRSDELLKPDDSILLDGSYMDMMALLSSCGLPNQYHALSIKCHELMASFVQGLDRPSISHLLQASYLTWQQAIRGINITTAVCNSFSDVYIKPRCGGDFTTTVNSSLADMKNTMLKSLTNLLENYEFDIIENNTDHTMKVVNLLKNSGVEMGKQNIYATVNQCDDSNENISNVLFSLFVAYQKCAVTDLKLQYELLKQAVLSKNIDNQLKNKILAANEVAYNMSHNKPRDWRFYPELWEWHRQNENTINSFSTLLYHTLVKSHVSNKSDNSFSALSYSKAVLNGNLTDDFAEYPILKNCQNILDLTDGLIEKVFQSAEIILSNKDSCELVKLLNWRKRFIDHCSQPIFSMTKKKRSPVLKEELVSLIQMQYYWLQKYLHNKLLHLAPIGKISRDFLKAVAECNLSTQNSNSKLNKFSKHVRKSHGQPKLYKDQNEYERCITKRSVYEKLKINNEQSVRKQVHKLGIEIVDIPAVFNADLALSVPSEEITNVLNGILTKFSAVEENLTEQPIPNDHFNTELLPLRAYVLWRMLNLLQNKIYYAVTSTQTDGVKSYEYTMKYSDVFELDHVAALKTIINSAKIMKGFPVALLNQFLLLEKIMNSSYSDIDKESLSAFAVHFYDEFYKELTNSPACYADVYHNLSLVATTDEKEELVSDSLLNSKRMSLNLPMLPYYVLKMIATEGPSSESRHLLAQESVSLKNSGMYAIQLGSVVNIIWNNITMLDTSAVLKIKSDAIFEIGKLYHLVGLTYAQDTKETNDTKYIDFDHILSSLTLKKGSCNSLDQVINLITHAITIRGKTEEALELNNVKDLKILSSKLSVLTSLIFVKLMAEISPVDPVEKDRLKLSYIDEDVSTFEGLLGAYYMQGLVTGAIEDGAKQICHVSDVTPDDYDEKSPNRKNLLTVHAYCRHLLAAKEETVNKIKKYASGNTFRPETPSYFSLAKDLKHFVNSIFSANVIEEVYKNLSESCDLLTTAVTPKQISDIQNTTKKTSSWLHSVQSFYKKIDKEYCEAFPDLAKPLLCSISQITFNVTNLNSIVDELITKLQYGEMKQVVQDLIEFPNSVERNRSGENLTKFLSPSFVQFVNRRVMNSGGSVMAAEGEILEMVKMNLGELSMHCANADEIKRPAFEAATVSLNALVTAWEKQQREIEQRKIDDDNLYVTRSKCEDIDEDEAALEEIKQMFPSYSDEDFNEFKPPTLEQKPIKKTEPQHKYKEFITQNDVSLIYKWHSEFVQHLTVAEWLKVPTKKLGCNYLEPLLERYPTFSRVVRGAWGALDADLEGTVSPSLLVLVTKVKEKIEGTDSSSQKPDFYLSAWVSEVKQCIPVLEQVLNATGDLLRQWPDFPTLKDIIVIANRILQFAVTSPVARFLTGLELLRDKIEEWNKNAHKGNNLIEVSLEVGRQIIQWRKLEMAHWKECLNGVYKRKQSEAHKYWFFMYSVVNSYLNATDVNSSEPSTEKPADTNTPQQVTQVLKEFMEKSNLAEYEIRLDIIYTYHCHLVHCEKSQRRDELLSILWNTHNYYAQFGQHVSSHIKDKRAPIEKKLRDYVKICSWDRDLSYWSVKDTVEKAHKTLHKHMKEFEEVLKAPASVCLIIDNSMEVTTDHVGIWDRPKRITNSQSSVGGSYMIDPLNYVALARNIKKYLDQCEGAEVNEGLLSKIPSLFNKAKKLCKETIVLTTYPNLVQALDDFVTQVIETSAHLGSLEVDTTAPKTKQTSQAKNILQQKRKALADLFRTLTRMGLSYRSGLVMLAASNHELYDFTLAPVDLNAGLTYLKSKRCDTTLTSLWTGCEAYYQKNLARHKFLSAGLNSPHQDLGLQNLERCKGFAAVMMKMTYSQKKAISKYSRQLCDLRTLLNNITLITDCHGQYIKVSTLNEQLNMISECYGNTIISLEQFLVLLKSCPEKTASLGYEPDFDITFSNSPIVRCFKNSEEWLKLYNKFKSIISTVTKQKAGLQKLKTVLPKVISFGNATVQTVSQAHIDIANEAYDQLKNIKTEIDDLLSEYQFTFKSSDIKDFTPTHPVLKSIVELSKYIDDVLNKFNTLDEETEVAMTESTNVSNFTNQTEDLVASLLLIIQSLYKKHLPKTDENTDIFNAIDEIIEDKKDSEDDEQELIAENHLKERLVDALASDVKALQLEVIITKTDNLLSKYLEHIETGGNDMNEMKDVLMRVIPILEQATLFVQYFVTQQVAAHRVSCKMLSVLLKIFSDLATKGFCKPADLDMEEGEGDGGPGQLSGGTGLGDGDGQKDVSEKIENQDQLDDARKPGEEDKEKDRDCKEEEKGVNMTDDFDSHLQDIDKKDGDGSDQDEDEDDNDKQMGETDNAAEKLDQQIWGSEEEESDTEQEQQQKKEERGGGESTGEKEMAAREEEEETGTDDGKGKERKEKKDINEMEQPEADDDQVDPYHGNQQPLPEPEAFDMPEDMNLDEQQKDDDKEGETETENPFDIDVMKEQQEQEETGEEKEDQPGDEASKKNEGLELSDDEEDNGDGGENEEQDTQEKPEENVMDVDETQPDDIEETKQGDNDPEDESQQPEENSEETPKIPDPLKHEEQQEPTEDEKKEANPQANPSNNDPSAEENVECSEMERGTDDQVNTNQEQKKDEEAAPFEQSQEQVGDERQSTGRAELDKSETGHRGERQKATEASRRPQGASERERRNKPGETEQERTLGEVTERAQKKTRTLNVEKESEEQEGGDEEQHDEQAEAELYQHVKQARKDDVQALDAATKEQAELQPTLQQDEQEAEDLKPDEEVPMDIDDDEVQVEKAEKELKSEKLPADQKDKDNKKKEGSGEEPTGEAAVEVEGERVMTSSVQRGAETSYHTRLDDDQTHVDTEMSIEQYLNLREWLTTGGAAGSHAHEAAAVWRHLWHGTANQSRQLSERLRLVLEPTGRSRLAGDYRTGRRINMRRVIPYIASHFRKDRIWLRRTKPAKREYKIAVAIDDSSSMSDNRSKELAFESLALVSQALNLLESGDLCVLSFGEKPNILHPFSEQFSEQSGAKILDQLRFDQTKTKIAQLVDFSTVLFEEQTARSDAPNAKLLVVVSDGRGIFSEGEARVVQAVRRAKQMGIFLVYVIIDNPDNKDSIMDIRKWSSFLNPSTNQLEGVLTPYLDSFPFPFYLILRDMSALPTVLGDALRQWFELAANTAS